MLISSIFYVLKGVVLTHQNLVATMKCLMFMLEPMPDEAYIAYLPLAHVLELLSENTMLLFGIKVNITDFGILIIAVSCLFGSWDSATDSKRRVSRDAVVMSSELFLPKCVLRPFSDLRSFSIILYCSP